MPRAVLKDGLIELLDPMPQQWQEGQVLRVESDQVAKKPIDVEARLAEFEALCHGDESSSDEQLRIALDEIRQLGKEQIRRKMGLP